MSESPLFVTFADGLECSLKCLFKVIPKKAYIKKISWYLVKVHVHYVNFVVEWTGSERTEKLPILL
jgi:hypothetical protein